MPARRVVLLVGGVVGVLHVHDVGVAGLADDGVLVQDGLILHRDEGAAVDGFDGLQVLVILYKVEPEAVATGDAGITRQRERTDLDAKRDPHLPTVALENDASAIGAGAAVFRRLYGDPEGCVFSGRQILCNLI